MEGSRCPSCGYDLAALPLGAERRCPECGKPCPVACGKCGRDLAGVAPRASGSIKCPNCGAWWDHPRVKGQPGWLVAIAVGLLPVALAMIPLASSRNRLEQTAMFFLMIPAAVVTGGILGGIVRAVLLKFPDGERTRGRTRLTVFLRDCVKRVESAEE